jgi:NADPH:quinone reductase-like Zn-dependent oxidoreductase
VKAIVRTKYGPTDILQLNGVPKPTPKDYEVLEKIDATTVKRTDCAFLRGNQFINRLVSGLFKPKKTLWRANIILLYSLQDSLVIGFARINL